jgi:hypothetical protein
MMYRSNVFILIEFAGCSAPLPVIPVKRSPSDVVLSRLVIASMICFAFNPRERTSFMNKSKIRAVFTSLSSSADARGMNAARAARDDDRPVTVPL